MKNLFYLFFIRETNEVTNHRKESSNYLYTTYTYTLIILFSVKLEGLSSSIFLTDRLR